MPAKNNNSIKNKNKPVNFLAILKEGFL